MSMEQKDEELQKKIEELALSVKEKGSSQIVNAIWKKKQILTYKVFQKLSKFIIQLLKMPQQNLKMQLQSRNSNSYRVKSRLLIKCGDQEE